MNRIKRYAAILVFPLLVACDEDSTGPTIAEVAGSYTLQTVNNAPLPFTLQQSTGFRLELTALEITLNADGSFTDVATFRTTEETTVTEETDTEFGTFSLDGNDLELQYQDGTTLPGTANGTQLRFSGNGIVLVFRKD